MLLQDNEPKHTLKLGKNYLKTKKDQEVLTVVDIDFIDTWSQTYWACMEAVKGLGNQIMTLWESLGNR